MTPQIQLRLFYSPASSVAATLTVFRQVKTSKEFASIGTSLSAIQIRAKLPRCQLGRVLLPLLPAELEVRPDEVVPEPGAKRRRLVERRQRPGEVLGQGLGPGDGPRHRGVGPVVHVQVGRGRRHRGPLEAVEPRGADGGGHEVRVRRHVGQAELHPRRPSGDAHQGRAIVARPSSRGGRPGRPGARRARPEPLVRVHRWVRQGAERGRVLEQAGEEAQRPG
mmetsp:Transcript_67568/g.152917  ORF Transcript_67568/g.152917 Transcript_67568/m.152917 type:complete len:222 (+) Transcript_67568:184-849(+)